MALIETLFSEYPDGAPADWTDFWGTGDFTAVVESNAAGDIDFGTKWLKYEANAAVRKVLTWDDLGSMSDVCIVAKFRPSSVVSFGVFLFVRVGGTTGDEDAYFVTTGDSDLRLGKFKDGAYTSLNTVGFSLAVDKEYWIKFQAIGTAIKTKIWAADCVEPDEWHLETTDATIASGAVGVGAHHNGQDFYLDYIGVDSSEISMPSAYEDDVYFGDCHVLLSGVKSDFLNTSYAICGKFSDSDRKLKGVRIYCYNIHDDQIRVGVYSGGSLITGPQGATLLKDFGLTVGAGIDQYIEVSTGDDIDIPDGDPLWIVVKGDNAAGFKLMYSNYACSCGNFQIANGRTSVEAIIGKDPDVAFAATFPAGVDTFDGWQLKAAILTEDVSGVTTTTSTSTSTTSTSTTTSTTQTGTTSTSSTTTTTTTTGPPSVARLVTFVISS